MSFFKKKIFIMQKIPPLTLNHLIDLASCVKSTQSERGEVLNQPANDDDNVNDMGTKQNFFWVVSVRILCKKSKKHARIEVQARGWGTKQKSYDRFSSSVFKIEAPAFFARNVSLRYLFKTCLVVCLFTFMFTLLSRIFQN